MTGGIDLKPFIDTVLGKTDALQPSISPDLKTALMERIDPTRQRNNAIASGLLQFAKTLGSTPGGFLQGLGAAAPVGAETYRSALDSNLDDRISTLDTINKGSIADEQNTYERAADKLKTGMRYNEYQDKRADATTKAKADADKARRQGAKDVNQVYQQAQRDIVRMQEALSRDQGMPPQDKEETLHEYQEERMRQADDEAARLNGEGGGLIDRDGNVTQSDLMSGVQQKKTINGVTYVKRNGKWGTE
jgi:cupin superfamily acireductone dioxygenase involved in methionine salvage